MYGFTRAKTGPAIFALSWTLRIALALALGHHHTLVEPEEPGKIAGSLAAGLGFSNPFACVTGPTAHLAPVYPFLLSLFYRLFQGSTRVFAVYLLSSGFVSLTYALLPWLAAKLRLRSEIGILAGLVGAAVPLFYWLEVETEWEAPLATLLLIVALGITADLFERISIRQSLIAGIVWGFALLTAPAFLPVFIALLAVLVWRAWRDPISIGRWGAALLMPALLLILPWTIRNYTVFHEFILIRGNAGLQLHMSFNPLARATFEESAAIGAFADHPYSTQRACREFAQFGEIAMNTKYEREAIDWIRSNPGRSAQLVAEHFVEFWRMQVPSRAKTLGSELITCLGLIGLGFCLRRHLLAGQVLGIVLLMYPLVYYINFFSTRYRYPLHPLLLILACLPVYDLVRRTTAVAPAGRESISARSL